MVIRSAAVAIMGAILILSSPFDLQAETRTLHRHVPAAVVDLVAVGHLEATQRLNLAIGLPLRNPEALTNLLRDIYDPASPRYHQYVTPEQFAERFGPSP